MKPYIPEPGRPDTAAALAACPRLAPGDAFEFTCAGCGDCCRARRDLLLSGLDLYRLARRLDLPPKIVARAFCKREVAPQSSLPALRLAPLPKTGNCPFFEGGGCAVHSARPLACALYPLGQAIDLQTGGVEYYLQPPLCGAAAPQRTLQSYLAGAAVIQRTGTDVRWAFVCTELSEMLHAAGGAANPHYKAALRRIEKALYYDYTTRDDFYPQFQQNLAALTPLLQRLLHN